MQKTGAITIVTILVVVLAVPVGASAGELVGWGRQAIIRTSDRLIAIADGGRHSLAVLDDGALVAWGDNYDGKRNVPEPNANFVAVAAGGSHSLGLKSDGSIAAWGHTYYGECNVPAPNADFALLAAGNMHSVALRSNGTAVAWGNNDYHQCNVPVPNTGFVSIGAGANHSLGVRQDGTVVAWGLNTDGQCNVPDPNAGYATVAGGGSHSVGLLNDGHIVAWGNDDYGQCTVPAATSGSIAVVAGEAHSLALRSDGSIVAWGRNDRGQCNVPSPNTDFVAIAAGGWHSLALKRDGTVVAWGYAGYGQSDIYAIDGQFSAVATGGTHCLGLSEDGAIIAWGDNSVGQCTVPAPNADFTAIAAGSGFSLGLKETGTIVAWGSNDHGECNVPAPNTGFIGIAAGPFHCLGLRADGSVAAWGSNVWGQCNVPNPNEGFVEIAAGSYHSLARRTTGSVAQWGSYVWETYFQPSPDEVFLAVSASGHTSLGLKPDGSLKAWGAWSSDLFPPASSSRFTAIAGVNLALTEEGALVAWGDNSYGQCNLPTINSGFTNIAAAGVQRLALRAVSIPTITNLVANPGFESGSPGSGWPGTYGVWAGDAATSVTAQQGIAPAAGSKMLKFVHGGSSASALEASQVRQLVDVSAYLGLIRANGAAVALKASFNRVQFDAQTDSRFVVKVYSFAGAPSTAPTQLESGSWTAMQFADLISDDDTLTWQTAEAVLHLPTGTDFVCIEVAAYENVLNDTSDTEFDGHYCDLVECAVLADPTMRLFVSESIPGGSVVPVMAQLSSEPAKSKSPEVAIVNGVATFTGIELMQYFGLSGALNSATSRLDLLDGSSPRKIIGHIGLKYTFAQYAQGAGMDCFVFLHDRQPAVGANTNNWGYYGADEYPVSMLVPPGASIAEIDGADQLPIFFVHGVSGTFDYWGDTPAIADQAQRDSWQFYYPYDQHLDESAAMLQEVSTQLLQGQLYPARPYNIGQMSIVTHSMGGLVVRRALEAPAFAGQVHRVMMFAPPNHGSYIAWRLAYDDYAWDTFLAELGEHWTTFDPEAPAYKEMSPASDWLRALNLTAPPRLDSGPVSSTYLVIAGIDDISALPHREMESQDDGVVSVSSASLTNWGIPLVLADEDHQHIHKSLIARDLLPWVWDGIAAVADIPNASDEELCILEVAGAAECAGVTGLDTGLGMIMVKIDRPPLGTSHYRIDGVFNGVLRLTKNGRLAAVDSEGELHRVAAGSDGFFSRCRRDQTLSLDYREIAHWLPPNIYPVELHEDGRVSRSLAPLTITHLGTTTGVILRTPGSSLACNAPNSSRVPPIEDKNQHSYAWTVDDHVDTLIFTLTAENIDPVLMPHGLVLVDPLGNLIDEAVAASDPNITMFTESDSGPIRYMIETPHPGLWTIGHETGLVDPVLIAGIYSEVFADLELDRPEYAVGDSLGVVVSLTGGASLTERAVAVSAVWNPVYGGSPVDIGAVHLVESTPGHWGGAVPNAAAGQYDLVLTMTGTDANGVLVTRTDMQTAWVSSAISDVTGVPRGLSDREDVPSSSLALSVYPNPFNASTDIHFDLPQTQHVDLVIYAIDGRRVVALANGVMEVGSHSIPWRGVDGGGRPTASGVYFIVLRTADGQVTSKTALLK